MAIIFHEFADGASLASALADEVADRLATGIAERGRASLAVSGGSTPKAFFMQLAQKAIDWSKVTVTLVDERFVPPGSARSNQSLVTDNLLSGPAGRATMLPLYYEGMSAGEAAHHATDLAIAHCCPFDVVVLGMGTDGHTASFFPDGNNLEPALDLATPRSVMTMEAPEAGETRLTFTLHALYDARLLVLHIEGDSKRAVFEQATGTGKGAELPVGRVLQRAVSPVEVFWAP